MGKIMGIWGEVSSYIAARDRYLGDQITNQSDIVKRFSQWWGIQPTLLGDGELKNGYWTRLYEFPLNDAKPARVGTLCVGVKTKVDGNEYRIHVECKDQDGVVLTSQSSLICNDDELKAFFEDIHNGIVNHYKNRLVNEVDFGSQPSE